MCPSRCVYALCHRLRIHVRSHDHESPTTPVGDGLLTFVFTMDHCTRCMFPTSCLTFRRQCLRCPNSSLSSKQYLSWSLVQIHFVFVFVDLRQSSSPTSYSFLVLVFALRCVVFICCLSSPVCLLNNNFYLYWHLLTLYALMRLTKAKPHLLSKVLMA